MATVDQLREQLALLDGHFGLRGDQDAAWIRCPWHRDGNERTPSLRINFSGQIQLGAFNCFGCPQSGNWDKLAKKLGLTKFGTIYEERIAAVIEDLDAELLETALESTPQTPSGFIWPKQLMWRGISGKLIKKLHGIHYFDTKLQKPCLYLPVKAHQKLLGGVRCLIESEDSSDVAKYRNTTGRWVKQALFPYDYVQKLKPKIIILVEGPRDALNLLQHGVAALSNLGAVNSWSKDKIKLLLDLEPQWVILGFDRDSAGRRATKQVRKDLNEWLPSRKLRLPRGKDPGALSKHQIKRLRQRLSKLL